jgi:hypothetical protein
MSKTMKALTVCVAFVGWTALYRVFIWAERELQPVLFAAGLKWRWWSLVLLFWIGDTVLVISCAYLIKRPFGMRVPSGFPFWQVAIDIGILVLLVHLVWLCGDPRLLLALDSVGLGYLSLFFIVLVGCWILISILRYRALRRMHGTGQKPEFLT